MAELGLRELKKRQTRQQIAEAAAALFAERGFDNVTVAEIARAASVSEKTVFNYFPSKEELIFGGMEDFGDTLLRAIRDRPKGTAVLTAFAEFAVQPRGVLASGDSAAFERLAQVARMIADSPALQAHQRRLFDASINALAAVLAQETGADDDTEPWVVANALVGVLRALNEYVHREVRRGRHGQTLLDDVLARGSGAVAVLERGLARYPEQ